MLSVWSQIRFFIAHHWWKIILPQQTVYPWCHTIGVSDRPSSLWWHQAISHVSNKRSGHCQEFMHIFSFPFIVFSYLGLTSIYKQDNIINLIKTVTSSPMCYNMHHACTLSLGLSMYCIKLTSLFTSPVAEKYCMNHWKSTWKVVMLIVLDITYWTLIMYFLFPTF